MYDIYFDLGNMHQTVDSSDNEEVWILGEPFILEDDGSITHKDGLIIQNDDYKVVKRYENGCTCVKCGELYPQAEPNQPDGTLICYSCRRFMKK